MSREKLFRIIDFDGWNVGLAGAMSETYLEFEEYYIAKRIADIWEAWIYEQ